MNNMRVPNTVGYTPRDRDLQLLILGGFMLKIVKLVTG